MYMFFLLLDIILFLYLCRSEAVDKNPPGKLILFSAGWFWAPEISCLPWLQQLPFAKHTSALSLTQYA